MNKIESHKFCGKTFQIIWDKLTEKEINDLVKKCNLDGPPPAFCETRDSRKPKIKFDIDAYEDSERLRIVLDEAIHACLFELDNDFVDKWPDLLQSSCGSLDIAILPLSNCF